MPNLPDGGDRIGWALKAWGDKPFYWISPVGPGKAPLLDGRPRLLLVPRPEHGHRCDKAPRTGSSNTCASSRTRAIPMTWSRSATRSAATTARRTRTCADFVRSWNERVRIAADRHRHRLGDVRGVRAALRRRRSRSSAAISPPTGRTARRRRRRDGREPGERRAARPGGNALVHPGEGRLPGRQSPTRPGGRSSSSASTPGARPTASRIRTGERPRAQWEYKKAFADEAERMSRELLAEAASKSGPTAAPAAGRQAIDVVNTCSWERTDLVLVPAAMSAAGDRVEDAAGTAVPSQRLRTGELAFLASAVPGFGAKRYFVLEGRAAGRRRGARADGTRASGTGRYRPSSTRRRARSEPALDRRPGPRARRPEHAARPGPLSLCPGRRPASGQDRLRRPDQPGESGPARRLAHRRIRRAGREGLAAGISGRRRPRPPRHHP